MFQCVHYKCITPLEHHSTLWASVLSFYFIIFHSVSFGLFHFFPSLYQLHGNLSWKNITPEWTLLYCISYFLCKLVLKADVSVCYYNCIWFCSVYLVARKLPCLSSHRTTDLMVGEKLVLFWNHKLIIIIGRQWPTGSQITNYSSLSNC